MLWYCFPKRSRGIRWWKAWPSFPKTSWLTAEKRNVLETFQDSSSEESGSTSLSLAGRVSGMERCSDAHAPRSMSLQRSLQKGRQGDVSFHTTGRLQVGQDTVLIARTVGEKDFLGAGGQQEWNIGRRLG